MELKKEFPERIIGKFKSIIDLSLTSNTYSNVTELDRCYSNDR